MSNLERLFGQYFEAHPEAKMIVEAMRGKIEMLEAQLTMKIDDWVEACKRIDTLEAQLAAVAHALDEFLGCHEVRGAGEFWWDLSKLESVAAQARDALAKIKELEGR